MGGDSVKNKVGAIVKEMGLPFRCETWPRANVVLDKFRRRGPDGEVEAPEGYSLPMCLYVQPVAGTLHVKAGMIKDAPSCFISFCDAMPLDFHGDKTEAQVEFLKGLAVDFITRANASGLFEYIDGTVPYRVAFDKLDANLCMLTIQPTLKEIEGVCIDEY